MSKQAANSQDREKRKLNPSLLFLGLLLIAFSLRMYFPAVCPSQEFFLTAMFAIGCGGLYSQHCGDLGIEILEKYKASGALAVVLVIFLFMPASELRDTEKCSGNSTAPILLDKLCCSTAYAQEREGREIYSGVNVTYIKIVYPIGKGEQRSMARDLKSNLSAIYPSAKITVFSYGSWRDAIVFSFRSFSNECTIAFSDSVETEVRKEVSSRVAGSGNCNPMVDTSLQSWGPEDIIVRIGE